MRILHLVYDCVPDFFQGGIQKVVYNLALHQSRLGHDVSVFTLLNSPKHGDRPLHFFHEGVNFRYFEPKGGTWKLRSKSVELKRFLLSGDFDFEVVHSHNAFSPLNGYAVATTERHGCKLFQHLHGSFLATSRVKKSQLSYFKKAIYINFFEKEYCNKSNGVFCLSDEERQNALTWNVKGTKLQLLTNGVDMYDFGDKIEHDGCNLLFMGRITPIKNLEFILKLFSLYKRGDRQKYRLVLAGDTTTYPKYVRLLHEEINRLGIHEYVDWMGFVSGTEQKMLFLQADAFIHMSHSEGMPMAVLEALSFGIPTLISTNCGLSEAENSKALVRVDLEQDLALEKLQTLLDNTEIRLDLRRNSVEYIRKQHDWSTIAKKSLSYYEIM